MNTEQLFRVLSDFHPLTEDFKKLLKEALFPRSLSRDHFLLEEFQKANFAYFIENGLAVSTSYLLYDNAANRGKKIYTLFWETGDIIFCSNSYFNRGTSLESVQLLEDSELLCISHEQIRIIFKKHPIISHNLAQAITDIQKRRYRKKTVELTGLKAAERYWELTKSYPGIELRVSQQIISAYLGITPQSLSRIRRERLR